MGNGTGPLTGQVEDPTVAQATDAFLQAMVRGDVGHLQALLADRFVLIHMTGYRQPKREWLDEIAHGQFRYCSINELERAIFRDGAAATVVSRALTDTCAYGTRSTWGLSLTLEHGASLSSAQWRRQLGGPGQDRR